MNASSFGVRPAAFGAYFAAQVVPGVTWLILIPVWLSVIGPAAYGRFAVTWVLAVASVALCTGWIRQAALRDVGRDGRSVGALPRRVLIAGVAGPGLVSSLGWAVAAGPTGWGICVAAAFGVSLAFVSLVQTCLQCSERSRRYAEVEIGRLMVAVALSAACLGLGIRGDVALLAGACLGNLMLTTPAALAMRGAVSRSHSWPLARSWWRYGWPMSLWLGLAPLLLFSDRIVLAVFVSPGAVGDYAAVSDVMIRGAGVVGLSLTLSLHPSIMRAANQGQRSEAEHLTRTWSQVLALLFLSAAALVWWLGEVVAPWLLDGLNVSSGLAAILLLAGGLWQVALFLHKPLEIMGATTTMLVMLAVSWVIGLVMCVWLASQIGATGAAISVVVGALSYCAQVMVWRWRTPGVLV